MVGEGGSSSPAAASVAMSGRQRKDALGVILDSDDGVTTMLGWTPDDLVGKRILDFLHPDDRDLVVDRWIVMLHDGVEHRRTRVRHRHRDGHHVVVDIVNRNHLETGGYVDSELLLADEGAPEEVDGPPMTTGLGSAEIISSLARAHDRLLLRIIDNLPTGVVQVGFNGRVLLMNSQAKTLLGVSDATTTAGLFAHVDEAERDDVLEAVADTLHHARHREFAVTLRRPGDETPRELTLDMRALHDETRLLSGAVLCLDDVTEANRLRAELEWRASMDDLTRCHNRNAILEVLQRALLAGSDVAVVYIDVDRFKTINDRYGHAAGDRLLVGVADRLAEAVRASDRIGRIGGDEFLVVCPDTIDPGDALAMADRLAAMLCTDHDLGPVRLPILVSIGVAHAATAGTGADALIAAADSAMYEAKRRRSGVPQLYLPKEDETPERTAHPAAHRPRTNEDGPAVGRRRTDPALSPPGDAATGTDPAH